MRDQFLGIEGGGTKFVCVQGSSPSDLQDRTTIKTTSPAETMKEVIAYIHAAIKKSNIKAIGLAMFGPLDLDPHSSTYGYVTTTPKLGWQNFNVMGALKQEFDLPIGFNTDVNGAALGEHRWGAARHLDDFLYLTVGTGIGGGAMMNGKLLQGAMHPEMGHMLIPQEVSHDAFKGVCAYHQNCLESLASGPAMQKRWQVDNIIDLPEQHPAWDLEAYYLGVGLANYMTIFMPRRIILGGGVMQQLHLFPKIRREVLKCLNGYLKVEKIRDHFDDYIVSPGLGNDSGICGAIALAEQVIQKKQLKYAREMNALEIA